MMYTVRILKMIAVFAACTVAEIAFADQVTVTTYVTKVQEERRSTRWTLTEWLRIKERMKLMDVWMAMFSDPVKDRFRPELNLAWLITRSSMERRTGDNSLAGESASKSSEGTGTGHTGRAQFWATNLVSSTLGVRTLNLDFGVEAGQHDSGAMTETNAIGAPDSGSKRALTNWYTANVRLFGKNIQDSSLVLKYGMLQTANSLQLALESEQTIQNSEVTLATGTVAGAELQLYLVPWLGFDGTYHQYMPVHIANNDHTLSGQYGEALGFIEISVLRLMLGRYEERWEARWERDDIETHSREWGYIAGLKLQI